MGRLRPDERPDPPGLATATAGDHARAVAAAEGITFPGELLGIGDD
jgi:hypothetical protein